MKIRILLLLMFLSVTTVSAQTFRGGIQGTVTDSTGAAVAGAQVTITSVDTGLTRTLNTDGSGDFVVTELPIGNYSVTVSQAGFQSVTQKPVRVDVSASQRLTFSLTPGEVKQVVEVKGQVPLIDTTNDIVGGTIEGAEAADLPINGRDFTKLLVLVPGATGDPGGATDSPGSFGLFSVNGNRGRSNNYMLDGTDMNDGYRNLPAINQAGVFGTPATLLPVDALAEIPVMSNMEAEYGRNSGAVVNLVTKSGTNTLHGSLYEFFRNNWLDARNFFNTKEQPQNAFRNNQFGGSLGGPLVKDRTFWFVAYEGQRERVGLPFFNRVPTQADINNALDAIAEGEGEVNPIALNILNLNPWTAGAAPPVSGDGILQQTVKASNRIDSMIVKLDHHLGGPNGQDLITGRYFFGDSDQSFPLALLSGGSIPGYNTVTPTRVQIVSLSYAKVLSSKMLLELRGGWNRFAEKFLPEDNTFDPASVGLNTTQDPVAFGLPLIRIGGYAPVGSNAANPRGRIDTNTQFFANLSRTAGKHNFKVGYEFRRTFINGFFDAGYRGAMSFDSLVDFLAGNAGGGHTARGDSHRGTFQNNHGVYIQDDFRATPRLTLNLGVRWDYYGVLGEERNRLSIFDPAANGGEGDLILVGTGGLKRLYPRDSNNFAPRVGFAWDLWGSGKTVLRGGWGLYYDAFSQDFFVGQLPFNTFNSGPAYNNVGPSPVEQSFGFTITPVACGTPDSIPIPNSTLCAPPAFGDIAPDVFSVSQELRTPYIQVYNLNLQQQVMDNVALQVGYVGSQGRKLFRYRDINQANPANREFPFPNFEYINLFESTAASGFNSLQASLNFRGWHGLTSSLDYTWSHSIDNASDGQDFVPNASQPDNSYDPSAERANSNFDTRHRFTWTWRYDFPTTTMMPKLLSGWAINGVVTLSSGQPYNVNYLFEGDFNGTGEFFGRPDLVGNPFAGTGGLNILNLAALAVPCTFDPAAGDCATDEEGNYLDRHIGNLPRNAFVGPNYRSFDLSLVKRTPITERVNMEVRADFFNVLNHPNLANPLWPSFGVDFLQNGIADDGRGIGFLSPTVTPDVGLGNPFLGGGGPRNIQLAVRFSF